MKKVAQIQEKHGLFSKVPRFVRTIVRQRLHPLEADAASFDRYALENRAKLKRLYALLHVKPGFRAQAVLFERLDALVPSWAADVGSDRLAQILNYPIDEDDI